MANNYLFRHEQFHHKVETACTRFECVLHSPVYNTHATNLYRDEGHVEHEEALATWHGITEMKKAFQPGVREVAEHAIERSENAAPPPYRFYSRCKPSSKIALYNEVLALETGNSNHDVMSVFSHVDHSDLRWGGRANYICRKSSPVASRSRLGGRLLSRRKLLKVLRDEAPGTLKGSKAHPTRWQTHDGRKSDLPGQKDIPVGTVKKILRDLGVSKSYRELFQGAR